jgi:hypothetical protein
MQNVRRLALVACIGFLGACSTGDSPTAPEKVTEPEYLTSVRDPLALRGTTPVPEDSTGEYAKPVMELIAFSPKEGTATIRNNGNQPHWGGLAVYRLNGSTFDQTLFDSDFIEIKAKKQKSFKVSLPDGCVNLQYDAVVGLKEAIKVTDALPNYSGDNLLDLTPFGGHYWEVGDCHPTPTPTPPPPGYGLAITKRVVEKTCAPPEQSATVTFEVAVTNQSSVAVSVNVSDPLTPSCNRSGLSLSPSQSTNYTCTGTFAAGQRSNTATASIVGQSVSQSASVNFTVDICPPNDPCLNVGNPTFSMTKDEGETTATVTSTLTYANGFTGNISITPPVSGFSGGNVSSGTANNSLYNRPASNQPALTVNGSWQVKKDNQVCKSGSGSVIITPKPPVDTCANHTPPPITGSPSVSTTATQVTVNVGSVAPGGGTFNPTLPMTVNRPAYNQSAGTWSTTYTLPYGPVGLNCTTSKSFSGPVPPKERTCDTVNAKVTCTVDGDDATCLAGWINPGAGTMKLDAGTWQPVSNGGSLAFNNLTPGGHTMHLRVQDGGLTCEDDDSFTIQASGCANTPATSSASQPFGLPNSNPVTETSWVNSNVSPGPYAFDHKNDSGGPQCLPADSSAKVVLLKAGQNYWYFLNVSAGQQLCSSGQNISHLSYFNCANP